MTTAGQPSTLRERRRQQTRDEIRRVALALVEGRGYDGVTVDLISERAGVSVRTFFNYFPNKESAMIAIPPPIPGTAVHYFLARTGPRALFPDLADLAVRMFTEGSAAPSDFESSIQIVMAVPALAALQYGALAERETQFAGLIAARLALDPADQQPAVIAAAFTGAIRVACQRWSRSPGRRTFTDEVRACVTLLSTAPTDSSGRTAKATNTGAKQ
jgi:AcrR family transcriptional regulator